MAAADPGWTDLVRDADGTLPVVVIDPSYETRIVAGMLATPGWQLRVFLSSGSPSPENPGFDVEVVKGLSFQRRIASRGAIAPPRPQDRSCHAAP